MLHSFEPLVSIVIPVYNGADYLGLAIESALAQSYANTEIIVVNDGSDDNGATREVARGYGSRIRYVEQENGGVAAALNRGIAEMKGTYFSWLSHDDVYHPQKVERQVEYLRLSEDEEVVSFTALTIIDGEGQLLREHFVPVRWLREVVLTVLSTSMNGCALLVPRVHFDRVGLFDTALKTVQDNDMWLRMALAGVRFAYIREPLVGSRRHDRQTSVLIRDKHTDEKELYYLKAIGALGERLNGLRGDLVEILRSKGLERSLRLLSGERFNG